MKNLVPLQIGDRVRHVTAVQVGRVSAITPELAVAWDRGQTFSGYRRDELRKLPPLKSRMPKRIRYSPAFSAKVTTFDDAGNPTITLR